MKAISREELEKICNENEYHGAMSTQVRTRAVRPTNSPVGKVYHEDKRFSHWNWSANHCTPLSLEKSIEDGAHPLCNGEKVEFYMQTIKGEKYIVTNQFKTYDTELRQYRWLLTKMKKG